MTTVQLAHDTHDLLAPQDAASPGGATPLLALHDLAGDRRLWRRLIPPLAEQHPLVVADLRGHGESPAGAADGSHEIAALAEDCLALLDRLEIGRACVAGRLAAAEAGGMEAVAQSVLDYEAPPRVSEDPGPRQKVIARWTAVSAEGYVGCARPDRSGDLATLAPQLWLAGELGEMREAVRRVPELAPGNARATIIRHSGPGCA